MDSLESKVLKIPADSLTEATLKRLAREFVLREGTDYGHTEFSLEEKISSVLSQIKKNEAVIYYNIKDESFDIRS